MAATYSDSNLLRGVAQTPVYPRTTILLQQRFQKLGQASICDNRLPVPETAVFEWSCGRADWGQLLPRPFLDCVTACSHSTTAGPGP